MSSECCDSPATEAAGQTPASPQPQAGMLVLPTAADVERLLMWRADWDDEGSFRADPGLPLKDEGQGYRGGPSPRRHYSPPPSHYSPRYQARSGAPRDRMDYQLLASDVATARRFELACSATS